MSGGLSVLVFVWVHDLWISDIWFNLVPMLIVGAVSGIAIVWSYQSAVPEHTTARWLVCNTLSAGAAHGPWTSRR